jgi:hypothetical protein
MKKTSLVFVNTAGYAGFRETSVYFRRMNEGVLSPYSLFTFGFNSSTVVQIISKFFEVL